MNTRPTPTSLAPPLGPASHPVAVPAGIEAQAEACWQNIIAVLEDAGMKIPDLVKITTYLVRPEDVAAAGAARAKHFGDARPGSATIIVKALVNPSWLIEIEAVAAARAR